MPPEPSALVAVVVLTALYVRGFRRLWDRASVSRRVLRQQAACFGASLAAMLIALESPLDALSASLFSAHMLQHMLLILVAGPLLVLGAPAKIWAWALPATTRQPVSQLWRKLAWLERIGVAFVLHSLALWVWHIPGPYDAALVHRSVHVLEHASFLGTAALFWWAVLRSGKAGYGLGVLSVFGLALQSTLLGAVLTFSHAPWYPAYTSASTSAFGLSPLEDQQYAGLIMWVPGGVIYLVAALWLFGIWMKESASWKNVESR